MNGDRTPGLPPDNGSSTGPAASSLRRPLPNMPRKVRHGIKLQSKLPLTLQNPVAQRWLQIVEHRTSPAAYMTATEFARLGQTVNLTIEPGVVNASVQGYAARPQSPRIEFKTLSESQWGTLISRMAGEALYVARLLASELPPGIDAMFASVGSPLLQVEDQSIEFSCDCGEAQPCVHVATAGMILAERLDSEPLLVFTMLGMNADRVLDRIRHARQTHSRASGNSAAHSLVPQDQPLPPLESCLDEFWHTSHSANDAAVGKPPAAHAPHALLRRLGPSPLQGKFPMVGLLASIYDAVSQAAKNAR